MLEVVSSTLIRSTNFPCNSNMKRKILIGLLILILIYIAANWFIPRYFVGVGVEGLFKIGSCLRDDEFGVTYRVQGTAKNRTYAEVIISEKYPSQDKYKLGYVELLFSNANPQKLYAIPCP